MAEEKNSLGYFTVIVQKGGFYSLQFVEETGAENYIFVIDQQEYKRVFPAGDPNLNDKYEIVFKDNVSLPVKHSLVSAVLDTKEIIFAEDIPGIEALQKNDRDGEQIMDLNKIEKLRKQRLNEIKEDAELMDNLEQLREEDQQNAQSVIENSIQKGAEVVLGGEEVDFNNGNSDELIEEEKEPEAIKTQVGVDKSNKINLAEMSKEAEEEFPM